MPPPNLIQVFQMSPIPHLEIAPNVGGIQPKLCAIQNLQIIIIIIIIFIRSLIQDVTTFHVLSDIRLLTKNIRNWRSGTSNRFSAVNSGRPH